MLVISFDVGSNDVRCSIIYLKQAGNRPEIALGWLHKCKRVEYNVMNYCQNQAKSHLGLITLEQYDTYIHFAYLYDTDDNSFGNGHNQKLSELEVISKVEVLSELI